MDTLPLDGLGLVTMGPSESLESMVAHANISSKVGAAYLVTMGPSESLESAMAHANISSKSQEQRVLRPGSWIENKVLLVAGFSIYDSLLFPIRFEDTGLGAERSIVSLAAAGAAPTGGDSEFPPG